MLLKISELLMQKGDLFIFILSVVIGEEVCERKKKEESDYVSLNEMIEMRETAKVPHLLTVQRAPRCILSVFAKQ